MIFKYMAAIDATDGCEPDDLGGFTDADGVPDFGLEAYQWNVGAGILTGFEDDTLRPDELSTRAQAATVFVRVINFLDELAELAPAA